MAGRTICSQPRSQRIQANSFALRYLAQGRTEILRKEVFFDAVMAHFHMHSTTTRIHKVLFMHRARQIASATSFSERELHRRLDPANTFSKANQRILITTAYSCNSDLVSILQEPSLLITSQLNSGFAVVILFQQASPLIRLFATDCSRAKQITDIERASGDRMVSQHLRE